jgi:hypothetical protein
MKSLLVLIFIARFSVIAFGDELPPGSEAVTVEWAFASDFEEGTEVELQRDKLFIDENEVDLGKALRTLEKANLGAIVIVAPIDLQSSAVSKLLKAANGKSRFYLVVGGKEALVISDSRAKVHSQMEVQIDVGKLSIDGVSITKESLMRRFDSPGSGVVSVTVTWNAIRDQEASEVFVALLRDLNATENSGRRRWLYCLSFQ